MAHTAVAMQSVGFYTAARAVHPSIIQSLLFIIIHAVSQANILVLLQRTVVLAGFLYLLIPTYFPGKELYTRLRYMYILKTSQKKCQIRTGKFR